MFSPDETLISASAAPTAGVSKRHRKNSGSGGGLCGVFFCFVCLFIFFLACEDFGRMFDHSPPALLFTLCLFLFLSGY